MSLLLAACPDRGDEVVEGGGGSGGSDDGDASDDAGSDESGTPEDDTGEVACEPIEAPPGEAANPPSGCDNAIDKCKLDLDRDRVAFACDNAPDVANPAQRDADGDGIGDVADLCPVIAGDADVDADGDGIGNDCDACRDPAGPRNEALAAAGVSPAMWIRAAPLSPDADGDGIGDGCDNCPRHANCGEFTARSPATVLDDVPGSIEDCQLDADGDGIGDVCDGAPLPDAAGAVGFAPADDFDQDGLRNDVDACPRLVVAAVACEDDGDCPTDAACTAGRCNHADADGDGVGNACDTCPTTANPEQLTDAAADDPDHDFVGNACEQGFECQTRDDGRPIAFFDVSVDGLCCVLSYPGDGALADPDGTPLAASCEADACDCREIPGSVVAAAGIGVLPPGCTEALADAGLGEANEVALDDVGGDLVALWGHACALPVRDQDLDGLGDACDLCPFAFDPDNAAYVDENGKLWPHDGAACNGAYGPESLDPATGCLPG